MIFIFEYIVPCQTLHENRMQQTGILETQTRLHIQCSIFQVQKVFILIYLVACS